MVSLRIVGCVHSNIQDWCVISQQVFELSKEMKKIEQYMITIQDNYNFIYLTITLSFSKCYMAQTVLEKILTSFLIFNLNLSRKVNIITLLIVSYCKTIQQNKIQGNMGTRVQFNVIILIIIRRVILQVQVLGFIFLLQVKNRITQKKYQGSRDNGAHARNFGFPKRYIQIFYYKCLSYHSTIIVFKNCAFPRNIINYFLCFWKSQDQLVAIAFLPFRLDNAFSKCIRKRKLQRIFYFLFIFCLKNRTVDFLISLEYFCEIFTLNCTTKNQQNLLLRPLLNSNLLLFRNSQVCFCGFCIIFLQLGLQLKSNTGLFKLAQQFGPQCQVYIQKFEKRIASGFQNPLCLLLATAILKTSLILMQQSENFYRERFYWTRVSYVQIFEGGFVVQLGQDKEYIENIYTQVGLVDVIHDITQVCRIFYVLQTQQLNFCIQYLLKMQSFSIYGKWTWLLIYPRVVQSRQVCNRNILALGELGNAINSCVRRNNYQF
eukprot:TRINITY_DN8641_c0_g2_i1.p1 TRINITY_DN8641_c0_g2~~TRINITY_DN8641_c0_g2_i1.p1  ORF type:complete len:488 (+),score=-15.97 TRINITY_DN8641_c0_g2_i1:251-1714(+)